MSTAWDRRLPDHELTQSDSGTYVEDTLLGADGAVVNLTGVTSVLYVAHFPGEASPKINAAGTVQGPALNGVVRYTFAGIDLDTDGDYLERWKVTFGTGEVQRFPASGPHKVRIHRDIA